MVTRFIVHWVRHPPQGCSDSVDGTTNVAGDYTDYTITGLEEGHKYTITVRTLNMAGYSGTSNTLTAVTIETGERDSYLLYLL